jgi:hypothetical protein
MSHTNKARDRGANGKLDRKYRHDYGPVPPRTTPKHWRKLKMSVPRRRENSRICQLILSGAADPDGIAPPLGNHKPHIYYW